MNNIFNNNENINGLYIGNDAVSKVYFGSNLVYEDTPTIPNYLSFTAKNGSATIGMSGTATPNVSYSFDGTNWTVWDYSDITIPSGSTVYVKGTNTNGFNTSSSSYKKFTMSGTVASNGNIMSLLYDDNFEGKLTIPNDYCFYFLFQDCSSLTSAPELPATTLATYCYGGMFQNCTSLTSATELPATSLQSNCYRSMFIGCTGLITAPQLPATTLVSECYRTMFQACTSLTTAPVLPAKTLVSNCYYGMFTNCSNLNYIKAMFTTTPSTSYTNNWVNGVASSGTYVKNSSASYTTRGTSAIPTGWTVQTASS